MSNEKSDPAAPWFSLAPAGFVWATGIEDTFVPQTERLGERVLDEYALTQHYRFWREDLDRAVALGVRALRWGIPWYKVEPAPGHFTWQWVDQVIDYAAERGLAIIADLMHYGTPLWLDNQFLNNSYPARVAAYAAAFTRRYRDRVHLYTPLNEPMITVEFCGERAIWPPYLRGTDGLIKLSCALAHGMIQTTQAIRAEHPGALIIDVEAAIEVLPAGPALAEAATRRNELAFLVLDLIRGRVTAQHPLADWLATNGCPDRELATFAGQEMPIDILGVNYYPETSVQQVTQDLAAAFQTRTWGGGAGLERAITRYGARYGLPMMITETSTNGTVAARVAWLQDSLVAVARLRAAGLPLVGYTWFPLFDLIDWAYRAGARPIEEFIARLGPPALDPAQVARHMTAFGWQSLDVLPLEAFLAPMGLYALEMQFDGSLARVPTAAVEVYRAAIAGGVARLGVGGFLPS